MAIVIAFLGVGAVAIPTGIISAGFVEQYSKNEHASAAFQDVSEVGEILIGKENELCGMEIGEIRAEYGMMILLLLRGDLTVLPRPELTVQEHDILIVRSDKLQKKQQGRKRARR